MLNLKGLTKKRALALVLVVALALLCMIWLRAALYDPQPDLSDIEGRRAYLEGLGWQIDQDTEEFRTVQVPEALEGIMSQYNRMQIAQGFDLREHLGESCQQYTYQLTNYPDSQEPVYVTLYIQEGRPIAGDIHTNSINGFMHGLKTGST